MRGKRLFRSTGLVKSHFVRSGVSIGPGQITLERTFFGPNWTASDDMSYADWPKGPGIVERHYATGKPFVCRPGVREFHSHIQHGDQPWDKFRGFIRPRELMRDLARDLLDKNVFA